MPRRKINARTALKLKTLNTLGDHSDGNGLTLRVDKSGAKRCIQRVSIAGRQRNLGLGGYPTVSLAFVRDATISNLQAIRAGRDGIAEKKEAQHAARNPGPSLPTFTEAAAAFIALHRPTWSNAKHAAQWESTLATYAGPVIGPPPVDEVTTAHVMAVLTPIWTEKHETVSRVRQRMEAVFELAIANGHRSDNPAGKHHLKSLPRMPKTKNHHRALPYAEVPAALQMVRESTADPVPNWPSNFWY